MPRTRKPSARFVSDSPAARREYYQKNKVRILAQNKKWMLANPEKYSRAEKSCRLRKNYGITLEQWEQMEKEQNYVCAICKQPESKKQPLSVDHNHVTGKIRALLCAYCNIVVEYVENSRRPLCEYVDYVKRYL